MNNWSSITKGCTEGGDACKFIDGILRVLQVVSEDMGMKLEDLTLHNLGQAKSIVIDKDNTTIVDGAGDKEKCWKLGYSQLG